MKTDPTVSLRAPDGVDPATLPDVFKLLRDLHNWSCQFAPETSAGKWADEIDEVVVRATGRGLGKKCGR